MGGGQDFFHDNIGLNKRLAATGCFSETGVWKFLKREREIVLRNTARFFILVVCVAAFAGFVLPHSARAAGDEDARITRLLEAVPAPENFRLVYQEIDGLQGSFQWHIKGSGFWVRLQPAEIYPMDKLDRNAEYDLSGIVLDQAYNSINIWVKKLHPSRPGGATEDAKTKGLE